MRWSSEYSSIAAWPALRTKRSRSGQSGCVGRVAEEARPERVGHRRGAHRGARVPGVRLLDAVDRERPDRVDGEAVEVGRRRRSSGAPVSGRGVRPAHCSRARSLAPPAGRAGTIAACRASDRHGPTVRGRPRRAPRRPAASAADRRPGRPHARCRRSRRRGRSSAGPTSPAGSRWSPAGRRRRPRAGWAGSGRARRLIASVGRDAAGRALVEALRADKVTPRVTRVAGARTGRIGVLVAPGRRAQLRRRPRRGRRPPAGDLQADWFAAPTPVHLPVYSLIGQPLGDAGRRAIELARGRGRARQPRPRVDRAAARRRPARGARAHRRHRARTCCSRPPPRPRRSSGGHGRRAAGARADRRRQARREGRHGPRPRRRRAAPLRGRHGALVGDRHDRAPATRSTPASSSAGSGRGRAGGRRRGVAASGGAGRPSRRARRQISAPRPELRPRLGARR